MDDEAHADAEPWRGVVNSIQYGVIFAKLDEAQVELDARRLSRENRAEPTREENFALLGQALAAGDELLAMLRRFRLAERHEPEAIRAHLHRVHERAGGLRPWPELPFLVLDARTRWPSFGAARRVARLHATYHEIEAKLRTNLWQVELPAGGGRFAALLRLLPSGDEVAVVAPTSGFGPGERVAEVLQRTPDRSPGEVRAAFVASTPWADGDLRG